MIKIDYIAHYHTGEKAGLSGALISAPKKSATINPAFISSLSDLKPFRLPLSNEYKGDFAELRMSNGDTFYIGKAAYLQLKNKLEIK